MNEKKTGSFYTPKHLVDFMYDYLSNKSTYERMLEPSAGDGIFLTRVHPIDVEIDAVEIEFVKAMELKRKMQQHASIYCSDYLSFESNDGYDLIIGNPPYLNKKMLTKTQLEISQQLAKSYGLPPSVSKNIWVSFILKSLEFLNEHGSIFFVLPYEFLQVDYAASLRIFLEKTFRYIEIVVFNEKVFSTVDQEVCLVLLSNDESKIGDRKPYISLSEYESPDIQENPIHIGYIERNKPIAKWSNSILLDEELDFLKEKAGAYQLGCDLFDSFPGIVTAANDFFILRKSEVSDFQASQYVRPIVSKSQDVGNKVIFRVDDYSDLFESDKKVSLLYLTDTNIDEANPEIVHYLDIGKDHGIDIRYKCLKRKRWFDMRLGEKGQLLFFKRYHQIPRIVINEANVYTTDIAYNVITSNRDDAKRIAFCFYNSLTLAMCEFNGRFYGGGVCELTPKEFKHLPIPLCDITEEMLNNLDSMLRARRTVDEIMDYVDSVVFGESLNAGDLLKLRSIRNKLMKRRLKQSKDSL